MTYQTFTLEYKDVKLQCDRVTGQVINKSEIPFEKDAVIKFSGAGPDADWKDLKVKALSIIVFIFSLKAVTCIDSSQQEWDREAFSGVSTWF